MNKLDMGNLNVNDKKMDKKQSEDAKATCKSKGICRNTPTGLVSCQNFFFWHTVASILFSPAYN
jgi:hypothetical protein